MGIMQLDSVIGYPPSILHKSENIMRASMPIAYITPAEPEFQTGTTLFNAVPRWEKYVALLEALGYTPGPGSKSLKVAFLADNFPTDSFTNEYGESFLNKMTDVASQGAAEIMQMSGGKDVGEAAQNWGKAIGKMGKNSSGAFKTATGAVGSMLEGSGNAFKNWQKEMKSAGGGKAAVGSTAHMMSRMLSGARVDFPQVWKNSGFAPSYTMTIRLYNPNPASDKITQQYVIGPIAALMCLAVPRSDDGNTYQWPFLHHIRCPGIFDVNPAFISNVTVIKGGDSQQIAWNQRLGTVDVRIDFGSLYNSMLAAEKYNTVSNRPTLKTYIDALGQSKTIGSSKKGIKGIKGIMYSEVGQFFSEATEEAILIASNKIASQETKTYESTVSERTSLAKQLATSSLYIDIA